MEQAFIEYLNGIYFDGYGEGFRDDNPDAFYRRLAEYSEIYSN